MIFLRFTTSNSLVSKAIRWMCFSPFSHVEILVPGQGYLGAHNKGGVQLRSFNYDKKCSREEFFVVRCPEEVSEKVLKFAFDQIGKPYDFTAIFGMLMRRNWEEDDSWYCSELVAASFCFAGCPLVSDREPKNRITPHDIFESVLIESIDKPYDLIYFGGSK